MIPRRPNLLAAVAAAFLPIPIDAQSRAVQVYILAGQSNMVGHGKVEMGLDPDYDFEKKGPGREIKGGIGSLRRLATDPETAPKFGRLLDDEGRWVQRDDVWVYSTAPGREHGRLAPGFGKGGWFGPEFAFGQVVGDSVDDPVLIIKTAWGGHSLGVNFRPPSSGQPDYEKARFKPEDVGASYRNMMRIVREVCGDLGARFPELKGREVRFAGFGWHQGWNDMLSDEMRGEYEANLGNLIRDVRKDLGVPDLPFVIANTGMVGMEAKGSGAELCEIQLALGDPERHPEFAGTVASVETRPFKRPTERSPSGFGYHWNHSGESHYLVGEAMARAMLGL